MLTAFPPKMRAAVYWVTFAAGLIVGALNVGYLAAEAPYPIWLKVLIAVYGFLAAGLGATAASHVVTKPGVPVPPEQPQPASRPLPPPRNIA